MFRSTSNHCSVLHRGVPRAVKGGGLLPLNVDLWSHLKSGVWQENRAKSAGGSGFWKIDISGAFFLDPLADGGIWPPWVWPCYKSQIKKKINDMGKTFQGWESSAKWDGSINVVHLRWVGRCGGWVCVLQAAWPTVLRKLGECQGKTCLQNYDEKNYKWSVNIE